MNDEPEITDTFPTCGARVPPGEPETVVALAKREAEQNRALVLAEAKLVAKREADLQRYKHLTQDVRSLSATVADKRREMSEIESRLPRSLLKGV